MMEVAVVFERGRNTDSAESASLIFSSVSPMGTT
jgi:hypothetical protein